MPTVSFTIDGVPKGKGRPRFRAIQTKDGGVFPHTYPDPGTKSYEKVIAIIAKAAMQRAGQKLYEGPVELCICAVLPVPESWSVKKRNAALVGNMWPTKKPDFDNIEKVVADALKGIVWKDDSQVCASNFRKKYGADPRLMVEVHTLEPALLTGLF